MAKSPARRTRKWIKKKLNELAFHRCGETDSRRVCVVDNEGLLMTCNGTQIQIPRFRRWRHGFFLLGAIFGTIAALALLSETLHDEAYSYIIDVNATQTNDFDSYYSYQTDPPADDQEDDEKNPNPLKFWSVSKFFFVISSSMYLMEALTDGVELYSKKKRWMFPMAFGAGAALDLCASVVTNESRTWSTFISGYFGAIFYCLSATLNIIDNRFFYWLPESVNEMTAILLGDALFLAGCVVDIGISYWDRPTSTEVHSQVAAWGVVSSLLWLLDWIMYGMAEVEMFDDPVIMVYVDQDGIPKETGFEFSRDTSFVLQQ